MKVTVSFSETKVVVPCGDGTMLIRELAEMAVCRFRKSPGASFGVSFELFHRTFLQLHFRIDVAFNYLHLFCPVKNQSRIVKIR